LVCEAYLLPNSIFDKSKSKSTETKATKNVSYEFMTSQQHHFASQQETAEQLYVSNECLVISMFFNMENGLLVYDSYPRGEIYSKLISVKIPSHFFVTKVTKGRCCFISCQGASFYF
jgi:hypothetical protein